MKISPKFKPLQLLFDTQSFDVGVVEFESQILKQRLLAGSDLIKTLVLLPKSWDKKSIVYNFSGLAGNGTFQLNLKFNGENALQEVDRLVTEGSAPETVYVFVDSINSLGGTQFINSPVTGRFEDHFLEELVPAIHHVVSQTYGAFDDEWVTQVLYGGSSGGYGVLQLCSKYPDRFQVGIAIAPDSAFELSLWPDCVEALPDVYQFGISGLIEQIRTQNFKNKRNAFKITNAIAMAACYAPVTTQKLDDIPYPMDFHTAAPNSIWEQWLEKDPCQFLRNRIDNVKKVKKLWLSVGKFDEHHLQYGARRIVALLKEAQVDYTYSEFAGGHRDLSTQRGPALNWLMNVLKELNP